MRDGPLHGGPFCFYQRDLYGRDFYERDLPVHIAMKLSGCHDPSTNCMDAGVGAQISPIPSPAICKYPKIVAVGHMFD